MEEETLPKRESTLDGKNKLPLDFNPTALKMAETPQSFDLLSAMGLSVHKKITKYQSIQNL